MLGIRTLVDLRSVYTERDIDCGKGRKGSECGAEGCIPVESTARSLALEWDSNSTSRLDGRVTLKNP